MLNKILIVDDDKEFRQEFAHCFAEHEVVQAANGEEALSILKKPNEIGLVILDVKMPGLSGTDVLARIKAISPEINVVILTGHSSESIAIDALRGHADDYIEKPFKVDEMREVIERLLGAGRKTAAPTADADLEDKVKHVKEFVQRNCCRKIRLEDAARVVSFCPKYLSRAFKQATGIGFGEYRIKVQMEKAQEFLASGDYNINQIADKLGYQNPESFIRQFKRFSGCTPTEYRLKKRPKR